MSFVKVEVGYVEEDGFFYYIKFLFVDGSGYVLIVIIRLEFMFVCVVVFVYFEDECYKYVVGKKVKFLIFEREVFVLVDEDVDLSFGIGVVYNCIYGDE